MRHAPECGGDGGERELQQHRAHGAAEHDQGGGGLQDLAQVAAFHQQAGDDAGNGQKDSADTRFIHATVPRRCATRFMFADAQRPVFGWLGSRSRKRSYWLAGSRLGQGSDASRDRPTV